MRVFLAGATGVIGQRLIPQLLAADHEVTAITRSPAKVDQLGRLGAEPAVVDGLDAVGMEKAVINAKPDAIVHQMTALAGKPDLRRFDRWFAATNELRTKGTDILLAAAGKAGVTRFVAQSYTGWNNPRTSGAAVTEDDGLDPQPLKWQRQSLAAIEYLEQAVQTVPLEGIVLRYGNLYGPGASDSLVELVHKRRFPVVGAGTGVWSWLHLDDAASAAVAALEQGPAGVYNVTDDDPTRVSEWLPYLARAVGAKPPMRVPKWLAVPIAGSVVVRWMTEGRGASNERAKRELGWQPAWASWREGFRTGLEDAPVSLHRDTPDPD